MDTQTHLSPSTDEALCELAALRADLDMLVPPPDKHTGAVKVQPTTDDALAAVIGNRNVPALEAIASHPPAAHGLNPDQWRRARLALFQTRAPGEHKRLVELECALREVPGALRRLADTVNDALEG